MRLVRSVVLLPLVLPPVVGGLALLYLLGRNGFAGEVLDLAFGIQLPFTTAAVVLAQTFVAMPFLVVSLEGALRTAGERYEAVAATLGAGRWTVFRRKAQRVALARALAAEPDVLLLDEPLSAVDVDLAPQLRALLRSLLWAGSRWWSPTRCSTRWCSPTGSWCSTTVRWWSSAPRWKCSPARGVPLRPASRASTSWRAPRPPPGCAPPTASSSPAASSRRSPGNPRWRCSPRPPFAVHRERPHGSPRNVLAAAVSGLEPQGELVRVRSTIDLAADITPAAVAELGLHPAAVVWFVVKATEVAVHPAHARPAPG